MVFVNENVAKDFAVLAPHRRGRRAACARVARRPVLRSVAPHPVAVLTQQAPRDQQEVVVVERVLREQRRLVLAEEIGEVTQLVELEAEPLDSAVRAAARVASRAAPRAEREVRRAAQRGDYRGRLATRRCRARARRSDVERALDRLSSDEGVLAVRAEALRLATAARRGAAQLDERRKGAGVDPCVLRERNRALHRGGAQPAVLPGALRRVE